MATVEPISLEEGKDLTRKTMIFVIVWSLIFLVAAVVLILFGGGLMGIFV
ncbi:hypothetical protein [Natronobeatus ordinarius]|nr:hypothetical protein [Natronobeatus ordinarius]